METAAGSLHQPGRPAARASYIAFNAAANAYSYQSLIQGQKLKTGLGYSDNF